MVTVTPDIRAGDVIFVWSRGFIPDAIEAITDGPSHCALFTDATTIIEAQGGRSIAERPFSYASNSDTQRLEIWRDDTLTDAERAKAVAYARKFAGTPYDYALIPLELAHFIAKLPLGWYHEHGRICSTFINDIATHIERKWSHTPNPAPVDISDGGALKRLYTWEDGRWAINQITESA